MINHLKDDTIAAISTAPGVGGIAVMRISGNQSIEIVSSIFKANKKDVEIKTIMNEGMNLSDFGFYDSQARDPNVLMAPELEAISSPAEIKGNIERVLRGRGLEDVDINVTTANNISGTQIMTDIGIYTGVADMQRRVDESLNTMSY